MTKHSLSLDERLAKYTKRSESGCLEWTGAATKDGRAMFTYKGKTWVVARFLWQLKYGAVAPAFVCAITAITQNALS